MGIIPSLRVYVQKESQLRSVLRLQRRGEGEPENIPRPTPLLTTPTQGSFMHIFNIFFTYFSHTSTYLGTEHEIFQRPKGMEGREEPSPRPILTTRTFSNIFPHISSYFPCISSRFPHFLHISHIYSDSLQPWRAAIVLVLCVLITHQHNAQNSNIIPMLIRNKH